MKYAKLFKAFLAAAMLFTTVDVRAIEQVTPSTEKVNVALNKPTTSTKVEGTHTGNYAVDGNLNSFWASKNVSWLEVDLEGYYKISEINLMNHFSGALDAKRYYEYKIYASLDQETYDLVAEQTSTEWNTADGDTYTYDQDQEFTARYIKVEITKTHAEGQPDNNTGHIKELSVYGEVDETMTPPEIRKNVAKGKPASASSIEGSSTPEKALDDNLSTFWAGSGPNNFLIVDLEEFYDVDEINVVPYYGDGRYYCYEVYVSTDGFTYEKIGEKNDDKAQTEEGDTYTFDKKTIRYVKVNMISNSANPSVHINELRVFGTLNPDYELPDEGNDNEGNIALNKPARSYSNSEDHPANAINDGEKTTFWQALYYPGYVDIDLEKNYNLSQIKVIPSCQDLNAYYQYEIYSSVDGVNFDFVAEKNDKTPVNVNGDLFNVDKEARIVRIYLKYCSVGNTGSIHEVKVYGEESGTEVQERAEVVVPDFEDTIYNEPITEQETLNEVRGVVSRIIGEQYNNWFNFVLEENTVSDYDYYEISNTNDGKIQIKGNKGLSLTTGLNHYLKYYCKVSISQQTSQVHMPREVVLVDEVIRKETPYEVRYAYNYCTHSYTMAFWGEEEWQHELDWLALNGMNTILDITGQEDVWRRFLMDIGYSLDEAKDWLVGPGYYGWQYMANMENVNGPIADSWFTQSVELARKNHRKMRALGMTPILQGYSGMVPNSIKEKDPNADFIPQGGWNGMQRPAMLKTNTQTYIDYAEKFYKAQREVYGDVSKYYATDPFHEGGNPGGIGRDIVGRKVLDEMLKFDSEAVWVIQSWSFQPALLQNITAEEKLNNILLLDLNGTKGSRADSTNEFAQSDWVYCMLENYGGRSGMAGNLEKYTHIPSTVKDTHQHMVGMGISPEGTNNNPVKYDLFLEMMWESEDIDLNEWIKNYIERRYGKYTENTQKAWDLLLESTYLNTSSHADPPESIINVRPQFNASKSAPNGNISKHYNFAKLEKALNYLMKDYNSLKNSEGYVYDITDILRQCIANSAETKYKSFTKAFENNNVDAFKEQSQQFLDMVDLQDRVLNSNEDFMVGTWLKPAMKAAEGQDDFTQMIYQMNSKGLISTWAPYYCWGVYDYANREYGGLTRDYYLKRWEIWIQRLNDKIDGKDVSDYKEISIHESHEIAWEWARSDKEYTTEPSGDIEALYREFADNYEVGDSLTDELKVDHGEIKGTSETPTWSGLPLQNALDDNLGSIWATKDGIAGPYEVIFEFDTLETISEFSILPRGYESNALGNGDILGIELYGSVDGEEYTLVSENTFERNAKERRVVFEPVKVKFMKLIVTETLIWNDNPALESVTAAEFNFYRPYARLESDEYTFTVDSIENVYEETTVKELLNRIDVSKKGSLKVVRNGEVLSEASFVEVGDVLEYYYNEKLVESYQVKELQKKADFTVLNELIQKCESLNEDDYTVDSWAPFAFELSIAIGVQVNPEATQTEIDEAVENLQIAINNLEKLVYKVTVDGEVFTTGKYNTKVTVEAKPVEGKEFTAWLFDGKVVSTDAKYTFFISEDMNLETCYEEIEVNADALLTNTVLTRREDGKGDVKFVAQLVLPEGYTVENAGLVWSSKEGTELSLENKNLKPTYITRISNTNQFSVTIKGMPAGRFIRGRIFATLVDGEGNESVVYSEEARVVNK